MKLYLEHLALEGFSKETADTKRRVLRAAARQMGVPLLAATPAQVLEWRASLTVAPDSVIQYVSCLSCLYDFAISRKLTKVNPARGIPVPQASERLPRPCPDDALYHVLDAAPPRLRPWLILAGWAGLRCKEIARLRGENVRIDQGAAPYVLVSRDSTKGGRTERVIPLSDWAAAQLRDCRLPRRGLCFPRRDGQPGPNRPQLISDLCGRHIRECGYDFSMHCLRHRFLTGVQQIGHDVRITQVLAGHRSILSTQIYTKVDTSQSREIVQEIPAPGPRRLRAAG